MSEYIGSVISLISKSDIRYLGTLHEINSESSTVALENVRSFGTEGRRGNPDDEIPPSDSVYEYIVFRGSDVKDLRIEEAPTAKENKPPQVPNDPAILGSGQRPPQPPAAPQDRQQQQNTQSPAPGQPPFPQHSPYPPGGFYPPPPAGWGRGGPGGPSGPGGFPPMPYGAPPGWYPPPGQGFPPGPGPYGYGQFPPQPFDQQPPQQGGKPPPIGPNAGKPQGPPQGQQVDKTVEPKSLSQQPHGPPASAGPASGSPAEKTASKETKKGPEGQADPALSGAPTGPRNGRIMPVIPLQSPNVQKAPLQANAANVPKGASGPAAPASVEDATRAASAAVAAAMAKLSVGGQQASNGSTAMDNLTKKVNEMRSNDATRGTRQVSAGHQAAFRGRGRGGARQEARKVEVPATDFDFASANAKFNKEDLVKEAIAGSPLGETPSAAAEAPGEEEVQIPATTYNKATSFFDNISSEAKERSESDGKRPGGREWRGEEQKKNIETFGQESVDNGYRGGYRGRGRGRGGYRGRGYSNQRGRGNYRGHGNAQQPAAAN